MRFLPRRRFLQGAAAAGLAGSLPQPVSSADDPTQGRTLAFDEQFKTLDWSIWNAGPKATTFDAGFYGRSAFAGETGDEGFNPYLLVDDPDATGGKALQISARYIGRKMNVPNYYGNDQPEFQWISGNLQTARSDGTIMRGWRRGYFEARMLFPKHPLSWPAFWLMNSRSITFPQTSVEVDIVEHKGWEPTTYGAYLHEWGDPGQHHEGVGATTPFDLTSRYCRYGALITDDRCVPYFEGRPVIDPQTGEDANWTLTRSGEMDANQDAFWPLLSLALVADIPYPPLLREEDKLTSMRVDYVRVYV
jgi:beta-glucanase (GH16 family)